MLFNILLHHFSGYRNRSAQVSDRISCERETGFLITDSLSVEQEILRENTHVHHRRQFVGFNGIHISSLFDRLRRMG